MSAAILIKGIVKVQCLSLILFVSATLLTGCRFIAARDNALAALADAAAKGSVRISWTIPTKRSDGSTLHFEEIDFYKLYYSSSVSGRMRSIIDLSPDERSVNVTDLAHGNHYFAMTTIDTNGLESELSPRISTYIDGHPGMPVAGSSRKR